MADTRQIYLISNDPDAQRKGTMKATVFCSDPSVKRIWNDANKPVTYLDMSEISDFNGKLKVTNYTTLGTITTLDNPSVTMTLTFDNRDARADWINKHLENVVQIAVVNSSNTKRWWNKRTRITSVDFQDNPYVNGVQAKITLDLFGHWQSSFRLVVDAGQSYPYIETIESEWSTTNGYPVLLDANDKFLIWERNINQTAVGFKLNDNIVRPYSGNPLNIKQLNSSLLVFAGDRISTNSVVPAPYELVGPGIPVQSASPNLSVWDGSYDKIRKLTSDIDNMTIGGQQANLAGVDTSGKLHKPIIWIYTIQDFI